MKWSYLQRCFNVAQRCENRHWKRQRCFELSNVQFNVETHNVVSTLLNVVDFNVDVRNVVSTLIWRCATSRRHINLKATMNQCWNVCWVEKCGLFLICSTYDSRSSQSTAEIFWQLCLIVFELTTRDSDSLVKFKVLQTNFFQETKKSRTVIISRAENYTKIPQTSVNFTWKK